MIEGRQARPFLLFDLGGVLIENVGFEKLDRLSPTPLGLAEVRRRWLASPEVRAFELGLIDPDAFGRNLVDAWALSCTTEEFLADFTTWPTGFYPGALDVLGQLRKSYRIGCLTNSNSLHWQRFEGFDGIFDVVLSSHRIGSIKPDAACFVHAIEACDVSAKRILFFDDAMPNVEGARAAGMEAEQVEGFEDLRRLLGRRGLIDSSV